MTEKVSFTAMEDGTQADYDVIFAHEATLSNGLADRVLQWLKDMDEPSPYRITRLGHSLQTATRAERDGADEETIVCALLHDIGDTLGPANHADIAATMLEPFVSDENHWMVKHQAIFQGYYFF